MVTFRDYTAEAIEACRGVLIELVHLMGEFRDHLVVVGGWVPALRHANGPEPCVGTLDVDLAVDFQRFPDETYQSVLQALFGRACGMPPAVSGRTAAGRRSSAAIGVPRASIQPENRVAPATPQNSDWELAFLKAHDACDLQMFTKSGRFMST